MWSVTLFTAVFIMSQVSESHCFSLEKRVKPEKKVKNICAIVCEIHSLNTHTPVHNKILMVYTHQKFIKLLQKRRVFRGLEFVSYEAASGEVIYWDKTEFEELTPESIGMDMDDVVKLYLWD